MSGIKTAAEIELIKEGGRKLAAIRDELLENIKVGTLPLDIDNLAKKCYNPGSVNSKNN